MVILEVQNIMIIWKWWNYISKDIKYDNLHIPNILQYCLKPAIVDTYTVKLCGLSVVIL